MIRRVVVCAGLLFPTLTLAQSVAGPYLAVNAGGDFANSMHGVHGATVIDTQGGPAVAGALGWRFGNGLRAELEGAYRARNVEDVYTRRLSGQLLPLTGVTGEVSTPTVMANLAYDIPVSRSPYALKPYVGVGAGYGWIDLGARGQGFGILNLSDGGRYVGPVNVAFGTAGAFAYQAILGASLPLRSVRGLELTAEYRFLGTANANIPVLRTATNGQVFNGGVPSEVEFDTFHARYDTVMIGLRYRFGAR